MRSRVRVVGKMRGLHQSSPWDVNYVTGDLSPRHVRYHPRGCIEARERDKIRNRPLVERAIIN